MSGNNQTRRSACRAIHQAVTGVNAMDWRAHFNPSFTEELINALRGDAASPLLSGFSPDQELGPLSLTLMELIVEAAEEVWADQLSNRNEIKSAGQAGNAVMRVSDVVAMLGFKDRNSAFVRELEKRLELKRDGVVVPDEEVISAIIIRARARRGSDGTMENQFRMEGIAWLVRYEGRQTTLPDSKGLAYIRYLLMNEGQDISVVKMLADITGDQRVLAASNTGEILDEEAEQNYSRRYRELEQELAELHENNSLSTKVDRLQEEMDTITSRILEAHGLGNRKRKMSDDVARIYRAVYGRITDAYDAIGEHLPDLKTHLENSIETGGTMVYRPEKHIDWAL